MVTKIIEIDKRTLYVKIETVPEPPACGMIELRVGISQQLRITQREFLFSFKFLLPEIVEILESVKGLSYGLNGRVSNDAEVIANSRPLSSQAFLDNYEVRIAVIRGEPIFLWRLNGSTVFWQISECSKSDLVTSAEAIWQFCSSFEY